jgi:hypothetical protein
MDVVCTSKYIDHKVEPFFELCSSELMMMVNSVTNCSGASVYIEKNNSNVLGPGPVNLTDVGFDKVASAFQCF